MNDKADRGEEGGAGMFMMNYRHILAGLCIFFFCVAVTAVTNAETHYVYPSESIQAAVDAASSGDTIFIYNGTYFENIVVDKSLILTGENRNITIINGDGSGDVVSINAGDCVISEFTVKNGSNGIHLSPPHDITRTLTQNETWSGVKLINETIIVPEGLTLNIEPGTVIKFKHYRGYKEPWRRLSLIIFGTLNSTGTPEEPIWFTSDAKDPINGDWSMIPLINSENSVIEHTIIEFGQQGLNLWNSSPKISNSIIRWHNWEGLYLESYSEPIVEYNRIYQNGYNGIAMEQFNDVILKHNLVSKSGTNGIHIDASNAYLENNYVLENHANGISLDNHATAEIYANNIENNTAAGIGCGEGNNIAKISNNIFINNSEEINCQNIIFVDTNKTYRDIDFEMDDFRNFEIDYIPGDPEKDMYMYVYPDEDETRTVINKIGKGLGLTWSVTWDGNTIWTATLCGDVYQLNPNNGDIIKQWKYPGPQAWGMTFDGDNLWINDFAEKKVYEMDLTGNVLSSFNIPDQEGGAKGITWDGQYLYIMGWTSPTIYKVNKNGELISTINLNQGGGGGLTWGGSYFWVPGAGKGIAKYNTNGDLIGSIYPASEGTWDLTWDGQYLWATQRTNENWQDEKLYQIQIIDDTFQLFYNNTIADNIITHNTRTGIVVGYSNNNTISRNFISHNGYRGIHIEASESSRVHDNTVSFSGERGIVLEGGGNNTIYDNIVHDNAAYGSIEVIGSTNNRIYNNIAYLNEWGISMNKGSNNLIQNNTVYSNDLGIHLDWTSKGNNILDNNVTNCDEGIALRNTATNNKIANNAISNNNQGIYVEFSYNNLFHHNSLINNTNQAYDDGTNSWDNGVEGNYWSDYEEKYPNATKMDGILDTPYEIPGGDNQDNYPLVEPFTLK